MRPELVIFLIAMTPIGELRASIPVAITIYKMNAVSAFFISVLGNASIAILLLFILEPLVRYLSRKSSFFRYYFLKFSLKARDRHHSKIEKYGVLGLMGLVAVPLPITGVWTAALVASLFGLSVKKASLAIFGGLIIAGTVVSGAVLSGLSLQKYFGWQIILGLVAVSLTSWFVLKRIKK